MFIVFFCFFNYLLTYTLTISIIVVMTDLDTVLLVLSSTSYDSLCTPFCALT